MDLLRKKSFQHKIGFKLPPTRMLVLYMLIVFVGTYSSIKSVPIRRGRPLISRNVNNLFGSLIPDTEIFPGLIALRLAAEESSTLEGDIKCSYGVSTSMYLLDKYNNIRSSSWPAINHSSPLLGLTSPWTIDSLPCSSSWEHVFRRKEQNGQTRTALQDLFDTNLIAGQ